MKVTDAMRECWKRGISWLSPQGVEYPDPTPLEMPLGFKPPIPLSEELSALFKAQAQRELHEAGIETFDDADDFDIPEDPPIESPWEDRFDTSKVWNRENEIRAGVVTRADLNAAVDTINAFKAQQEALKAKHIEPLKPTVKENA